MTVDSIVAALRAIKDREPHAPECLVTINEKMSALHVMEPPCICDREERILQRQSEWLAPVIDAARTVAHNIFIDSDFSLVNKVTSWEAIQELRGALARLAQEGISK